MCGVCMRCAGSGKPSCQWPVRNRGLGHQVRHAARCMGVRTRGGKAPQRKARHRQRARMMGTRVRLARPLAHHGVGAVQAQALSRMHVMHRASLDGCEPRGRTMAWVMCMARESPAGAACKALGSAAD